MEYQFINSHSITFAKKLPSILENKIPKQNEIIKSVFLTLWSILLNSMW